MLKTRDRFHPSAFFGVLSVIIVLGSSLAYGQSFKREYKEAKELYDRHDYTHALDAFKPLIPYDQENPYSEYASYYYGMSALNLGFNIVAKDMFLQELKLYPKWGQINEVNFSLAKVYFEQKEPFQAMRILKNIKDPSFTGDIVRMEKFYLSQLRDAETLKMMMEEYPADENVARLLVRSISLQPLPEQDVRLFDSLVSRFKFKREDFISSQEIISRKKERYAVSLLLPFLAQSLEPSPVKKRNQFVLDLYEGMKLGVETLHSEKIQLDLYAYDTERSVEVTRRVLANEELKGSDLLVGPLFTEEARLVLDFSEKNKINVINPVSNNSDFLGKDPFALLYQPSHETLGTRSAEFVASNIKNKNCIVYFGDSPKDSVKAFSYMKKALELGVKIVLAEEIRKETSAKIFSYLATGTEFDEFRNPTQFKLKRDSIGSIYVATDDPVIYSKVVSGVEARGDSIVIIGNESWINEESSNGDYAVYERLGVVFEAPNFTSAHLEEYTKFRTAYLEGHSILPSDYARLGYEFMLFVGRSLNRYGVYFQTGLSAEPKPLDPRYDFRNARDNQVVPHVYFHAGDVMQASRAK